MRGDAFGTVGGGVCEGWSSSSLALALWGNGCGRQVGGVMIPGVPEATAVANSGAAVLRGVKSVQRSADFPDIREGLWELVEIMHQWHCQAEVTSRYVRMRADELDRGERERGGGARHRGRVGGDGVRRTGAADDGAIEGSNVGGGWGRRNYERVRADLRQVMNPPASLVNYLRPKQRRSQQRRSLRTVLRIYCPELLEECEAAFEARGEWVLEHRRTLNDWLESKPSGQDRRAFLVAMDDTADALLRAAVKLSEFVRETFPLREG